MNRAFLSGGEDMVRICNCDYYFYNGYVITEATIKDFQEVIKAEYDIQLSSTEATSVLENWVNYFDLLAKINYRAKTGDVK